MVADPDVLATFDITRIKEAVAQGDTTHAPALADMKGRWRRPIGALRWYEQAKRDFAALPEG